VSKVFIAVLSRSHAGDLISWVSRLEWRRAT